VRVGKLWRGNPPGRSSLLNGELLEEGEPISTSEDLDPSREKRRGEWMRCSGLFMLLKPKGWIAMRTWQAIMGSAQAAFRVITFPPVPTQVRTSGGVLCRKTALKV